MGNSPSIDKILYSLAEWVVWLCARMANWEISQLHCEALCDVLIVRHKLQINKIIEEAKPNNP